MHRCLDEKLNQLKNECVNIMCIYIYPWLYPFAGGHNGVVWGGVGMMTFLAHEHIFDATEMMSFLAHEHIFDATENWGGVGWGGDDDVPCTWTHLWCYGELGWGGVGMMTLLAHEHIFDATEMMSFLAHEHIFVQIQRNSSSRCCSIAQKASHNVSAECFAVVQKWL